MIIVAILYSLVTLVLTDLIHYTKLNIDHETVFGSEKRCLSIRHPFLYPIAKNKKIEKYKSK